ncbi:baseplate J/gp47 family protein [Alkaliphilus sp. B6464]|uniref:baseplate J/gp47 family protein n=1 Tax=Alkaliphilus sp. B6464 TaxID=2731219 RepID=UPI001BA62709|nr:baseplate J/gp47 family protein [Alkaliphilus sp. B6464]QUH18929.1 baseplate J/gp47 family protein [Alkaliphilus sp. B6464]
MYEKQTFEAILGRMLARVPNNVDKREGSIIYDALAPAAAELAMAYIQMDVILNETFADTASRKYLIRRAAERGINPNPATKTVLKGVFKNSDGNFFDIPIGSRLSLDNLNYVAIEKIEIGQYKMECETAGSIGNQYFGSIIPIEYIPRLATAELTEILIPGEDEEETESLRQRYFNSLESEAFGGNIADYKDKINKIQGVGGVKVYPVWNGGGSVKLTIIDSEFKVPSTSLISTVQTIIDPIDNSGQGVGIAPIGHKVTVEGVSETLTNITTNITFQDGYVWEDIKPYVEAKINEYYNDLAKEWADNSNLVVRISQIEVRLLDITGILDIQDTSINGAQQNLVLESNSIPKLDVIIA